MCNLMARCISYFTMLVELLIIKNVKAVSVMLLTGYSSLIVDAFYTGSINFNRSDLERNKAYI